MRLPLVILAIGLLLLPRVHAQATINSFSVTYAAPGYVIDADATDGNATTNRHYIAATAEVNFTVNSSYQVNWSLLDPVDAVVGTGTTVLGAGVVGLRTINGQLMPSTALAPGVLYRAKMNVIDTASNTSVATQTRPSGHKYLHFTGTNAANALRNVIGVVDSMSMDRDWLLETDPTKTTLPVTVNFTLHRYDAWTTAPTSTGIEVRFNNNAVVQSPGPGAVAGNWANTALTVLGLSTHTGGATPAPATVSESLTMQFDPATVQENYESLITASIEHLENPSTGAWKTGKADSVAGMFAHLTGQLNFGGFVTNFTSVTSVVPGPPVVFIPGGGVNRDLAIPAGAGSVPGFPNHTYGGTIGVVVNDGIAYCRAGESTTLDPANPLVRINALNGVTFNRSGTITLDATGAHLSEIKARLPAGVGWAADRTSNILESWVTFGPVDLGSNLVPGAAAVSLSSPPGTFFLCEETKPVYIGCPELTWDTAAGEFQAGPGAVQAAYSIRQPLLDWLSAQAVSPEMMLKKSNDHLYNHVTAISNARWKTGVSNGGEMNGAMVSLYNKLTTHFPYATELVWNGGFITIADDLINPTLSGFTGVLPAYLLYGQHCMEAVENDCGGEKYGDVTVTPANYRLTGDGGIQFPGPPTMPSLQWGHIDANAGAAPAFDDFAHTVTTAFPSADFLMAGTFLRGDQNALADEDGASVLLLSGFDPANLAAAERPAGSGYEGGAADYAGVNFRCDTPGFQGLSTLQGGVVGPYSLTTRSKYYARWSGVTGIHEAPAGGFPGAAVLGGYDFTFDSFGFSFLSTEMEESRADGAMAIVAPVDESFEFTGLRFTCLGMLDSFELDLPAGVDPKTFRYWDAPITPYTAQFVATNDCNPGAGTTFVLGFKAHVAQVAEDISGQLGIRHTGNFAVPSDPPADVADSVPTRLTLPSTLTFDGPTGETYTFHPAQLGYLNNPDKGSDASGVGYWNFFGTLDVPFFKDMQVNLHTRCRENPSAMLDLMGGWPAHGWTDSSGDPFSSALFDKHNAGFPWDAAGVTTETYRAGNTTTTKWLPRAQQNWLGGLISFDYPCTWNSSTRDFTGVPLAPLNLLVLNAEHQLTYLSAYNAELNFGIQYDGLPSISVANLAFTALDEATNFGASWVTSQGDKVFDGLDTAVAEFGTMLEDRAEAMVDDALQRVLDSWLTGLIDEIKLIPTTDPVAFRTQAKASIHAYLLTNPDNLTTRIQRLVDGTDAANDLLADLNVRLERIKAGLKGVTTILNVDPASISLADFDGTPLATAATGLLVKNGSTGEREAMTLLAKALVDLLSTIAVDAGLEEAIENVLAELEPTLDSLTATIGEIYDLVSEVQAEVQGAGELVGALRELLTSPAATTSLNAMVTLLDPEAQMIVDVPDIDLSQLATLADEWKEQLRQMIRDSLYASELITGVQQAVKERLYDVQQSFNQAIDAVFATVNQAVRDALEPVLDSLDSTISDLTGDIASKIGAGSINGYAHFNADSLDLLHLDGEFEFNLDEPLTIQAYLEIKELTSDGGTGSDCTPAGVDATEVTIGAKDIGLTFMSSDIRMDIETKFALASSGLPVGLGGSFEMTDGSISYETFKITELGAAAMFGLTENYLGAKVAMTFGSYAAAGGFFIGLACDPDPLTMIDPLIGPLVSMPFSGIYAYAEAEFPIFGTGTCLFNISGKAGAGVLYNSAVPEYGGRMTLGVTGEALCAVTIGGEVTLAGVKTGSVYNFAGTGRLFGEVGKCPFCVSFDKSVGFTYTDADGWDVDY